MSAYREPAGADALPHCLGLAYAGTRSLDAAERARLATQAVRQLWQLIALALGGPAALFATWMVAARAGAAWVVVLFGAVFAVGTIAAWSLAVERALMLLRVRRDRQRGEVLRFEGVLPDDVLEDASARQLASMALLRESVATSIELLPSAGLAWRVHDVLVEVPLRLGAEPAAPRRGAAADADRLAK